MDDRELLARCVAGEASAWSDLVRGTAPLLHGALLRMFPGRTADVEDAVQAVFLKLWEDDCRRLRQFEGRCRLSTWLVTVARREALERVRARGVAPLGGATACTESVAAAADVVAEADEDRRVLLAAVGRLAPRERLLVRLVYLDGCSFREAASLLGVSENSVGPWLQRARKDLEARLAPSFREDVRFAAPAPSQGRSER